MKIVAISDTHGSDFIDKIPTCDILIIAGDISPYRLDHSYYTQKVWFEDNFIAQLKEAKEIAKHIVFIAGNHDTYLYETHLSKLDDTIRSILPENVHYLCDSLVEIEGLKIYGTPWCVLPDWGRKGSPVWNFAERDPALEPLFAQIPNDIDILVSHGPAYGFCDEINDPFILERNKQAFGKEKESLGSRSLIQRIINGVKAQYVISGHIHSAQREFAVYKRTFEDSGIKFACVSILNEGYSFSDNNKPLIINA